LAQSGDPVGYVDRKRGAAGDEVWIERGERKVRAVAGTPLHVGDVVKVRGKGNYAELLLAGQDGVTKVSSGRSFAVNKPPEQGWVGRFSKIVSNIGGALGITDRIDRQRTATRGIDGTDQSAPPPTAELLTKVAALETSTLYAARELDTLALRWCGNHEEVRAFSEGVMNQGAEFGNVGFGAADISNFVLIDNGEKYPADELHIKATVGDDLIYPLKWIPLADVPRPASLVDIGHLGAADKVEWANWLIEDTDGTLGNQYNLIAFSLFAEAREHIWLAGLLLERASYCPSSSDESAR
jgi:hypothetical protein